MATAYSSNLALALPVTGELSGTWGTTVNSSITNMLDEALGYQAYSATGGADTLTIPDGTTGVARSIYIQLNGTGGGSVAVPTTKTKMYFVFNNTASAITFKVTGQTGVSIPAAAKIALVSNGTDIIVAQNHFAGTLSATGTLTLSKVSGSADQLVISDTSNGAGLTIGADTNLYRTAANKLATDDDLRFGNDKGVEFNGTANYIRGSSATGVISVVATTGLAVTGTLSATGNVGFGTTAPAGIAGYTTLKINNATTGALLDLAQADVMRGRLGVNSTEFTIETSGTIPIMFAPAGSEAMRVDGGARLLVGVQTPSISAAQSGEFYGVTTYGYVFVNTTAGNYPMCVWNKGTTGTRALVAFMQGASAAIIGSITYNGTVTVYNTTSDYRLKTVIGAVTDAGQRIDALQPVEYTWNANGTRTRGFLAHQFQEVYADSVTGAKDAVDADGKPAYQQMQASTSEVIADLVAELQSLRARVAQLESKP